MIGRIVGLSVAALLASTAVPIMAETPDREQILSIVKESRDATIERHVPEVVLLMMFATFILSGAMLGYGSGVAGARPATPVYLMMTLIVLLVFMIIDLDRPRRGLIEVNQEPMRALLETMRADR